MHNVELHNFYPSPNIIRMIKSRIRLAGHVACMRLGMHIGFWWESKKEKRLLGGCERRWENNIKMVLTEI
jgi:hypothetical protein